MKVTTEMLQDLNACKDHVVVFETEWPDGMDVTRDSLQRAFELDLDVEWLLANLCPEIVEKTDAAFNKALVLALEAKQEAYALAEAVYTVAYAKARAEQQENLIKLVEKGS